MCLCSQKHKEAELVQHRFKDIKYHESINANKQCVKMLGIGTGMGKPTVIPKQVTQVQVRCSILAHRGIPHTHTAVSWVCMGIIMLR